MRVGKTVVAFRAAFAAADGGEEFAVEGDAHLRQAGFERGGGSGEVARCVATCRAERPLRAGEDDGFVQAAQGEGKQRGGVGQRVRAVQQQNAVVTRDVFRQ